MTTIAGLCLAVAVLTSRRGRRPRARLHLGRPVRRRRAVTPAQAGAGELSLCLDLLAGALACGSAPSTALRAATSAAPKSVARSLTAAATALSAGEPPATTWAAVAAEVPALAEAARVCARAAVTGSAVADELHRLADAARSRSHAERRRRLQRAAVWLVLPLGVCFLPAFVLVGVVPVIIGSVPALLR
jgi:Flp pilus assembly protein TadB